MTQEEIDYQECLRRGIWLERRERRERRPKQPGLLFPALLAVCLGLALVSGCFNIAHAKAASTASRTASLKPGFCSLDRETAIKAIIGEAEGEPYAGKLAIAEIMRKRGSFRGIYGQNSPRVQKKLYSAAVYQDAARAWDESRHTNISENADGWGNAADLVVFRQQKWFKNCEIVKQIGRHYLWRDIRHRREK